MPDRDKVIKGLDCCFTHEVPCGDCPYFSYEDCEGNLRHDILALLIEQDDEVEWCERCGRRRLKSKWEVG